MSPSERVLLKVQDAVVLASDDEDGDGQIDAPTNWPKRLSLIGGSLLLACIIGALVSVAGSSANSEHLSEQRDLLHMKDHEGGRHSCHTSTVGSKCYRDVDFAMKKHIEEHPDWYEGLSKDSSFEEFQEFLHHQTLANGKARCPVPCDLKAAKARTRTKMGFNKKCHTTRGGEPCFSHVKYTLKQIPEHPDWYPGLNKLSSMKMVQHYLSKEVTQQGERVCPKPCDFKLEEDVKKDSHNATKCHDSVGGEQCYTHVKETIKLISKNIDAHPDWYPGLSKNSSFKAVQQFMHEERDPDTHERVCPRPCGRNEKEGHLAKADACSTAKAGEACYNDIHFAMSHAKKNPSWYRGLTSDSTPDEFQAYLAGGKKDGEGKVCPLPCNPVVVKRIQAMCRRLGCHDAPDDLETCKTAVKGTECYKTAVWVATKGYKEHSKWYPGISPKSSFEQVQNRIYQDKDTQCPDKACPCHTAVPGEPCYKTVQWVKKYWVKLHPEWYGGNLTTNSTFESIQRRLHYKPHNHRTHCPLPCAPRAWPWRSSSSMAENIDDADSVGEVGVSDTSKPGDVGVSDTRKPVGEVGVSDTGKPIHA